MNPSIPILHGGRVKVFRLTTVTRKEHMFIDVKSLVKISLGGGASEGYLQRSCFHLLFVVTEVGVNNLLNLGTNRVGVTSDVLLIHQTLNTTIERVVCVLHTSLNGGV